MESCSLHRCLLQTASCKLQAANNCNLQTASCELQAASCEQQASLLLHHSHPVGENMKVENSGVQNNCLGFSSLPSPLMGFIRLPQNNAPLTSWHSFIMEHARLLHLRSRSAQLMKREGGQLTYKLAGQLLQPSRRMQMLNCLEIHTSPHFMPCTAQC